MVFLDTNIFVYTFDGRDQRRRQRARGLVAAALHGGCDLLFTEDLQHGLKIRDLTVTNPFVE